MHFDLPDLRVFIHIAEAKSITGGAERAHISTAAVSTRIKSLEEQLGSRLLYRSSKGVELTPAGEKLLKHARAILRQVDFLKSDFSEYGSEAVGHLRIFANTTAVSEFMPAILARFLADRPRVTVDLQERSTQEIIRGIKESAADLGLVAGDIPDKGIEIRKFREDRLVVVTPTHHPLAKKSSAKLLDCLEYSHVSLRDDSTLLQFVRHKVRDAGAELPLRVQVLGFEPACQMIGAGVGIGILPESCARRHQASMQIELIPLNESWALRERSVIARDFMALPSCGRELLSRICESEEYLSY